WDMEGKKYFDFLSSYSAVNQGHCHPRLVNIMKAQCEKLTLTSRAFHNSILGSYAKYITQYFGYQKMLPMNSGVEAVETAIKITRKWGVVNKDIPDNESQIIVCSQNFHGRTTTVISFSSEKNAKGNFGPHTPGFINVPYDDLNALKTVLESNKRIAGFLMEPIQGEAGVRVPAPDYCQRAHDLCQQYNVLFIADEIQSGLARSGSLLATCGHCQCKDICQKNGNHYTRPDIVLLGKALSGGLYPISAVLCDSHIMDVLTPGDHGSTFGGNPLASAIAIEALKVIQEEQLMVNARKKGAYFRYQLEQYQQSSQIVQEIRGRGLLNAVVIHSKTNQFLAWDICLRLRDHGLLAKPTHGNIIRFAPPLIITKTQMKHGLEIIINTFKEFEPTD
ncbi:MAG: ornithine--oxo-acid transaminase, partial [Flavobacteriaceae bacterium]|nr:ornithine--oxo-acid transaminase [Flavobacteriaceae bacterium]